jgi:hypothetical protein
MSLRSIQSYRKTECPVSVSELYIEAKPLGMDGALRSQTPSAQRNRTTERAAQPNYRARSATELPSAQRNRTTERAAQPNYRARSRNRITELPRGLAATNPPRLRRSPHACLPPN